MASEKSEEKNAPMEAELQEDEDTRVLRAIEALKQELNFSKSDLCLLQAAHQDGSSQSSSEGRNSINIAQSIAELEADIDRLCVQEAAYSYSLEVQTHQNVFSSVSISNELNELLYKYCSEEIQLSRLSSEISKEYKLLREAQERCLATLQEYMVNEREQSRQFQEQSSTISADNDQASRERRRKLSEIRFMQLIIPRILSGKRVNFEEEPWLADMCRSVRDPILSSDDLL